MNFVKLQEELRKTKNEFQLRRVLDEYIKKETHINGLWEELHIDLLYPNVVIETKKYNYLTSLTNLNKTERQIKTYMQREMLKYGCITDGKNIHFYEFDSSLVNKIHRSSNVFNESNFEYLLQLIKRGDSILCPLSLEITFGTYSHNEDITSLIKKFAEFFNDTNSLKKNMLFKEWEKLFKIAEEDKKNKEEIDNRRGALSRIFKREINNEKDESECLFILHNVLSIIIKLLIYNVLLKSGFISSNNDFTSFDKINDLKKFMYRIEHGEVFYEIGIYNLIMYDYFSWYVDDHIK